MKNYKKPPNCECVICKKSLYRRPSRWSDHPLCSYSCRNRYFSGNKSFVWRGGERDKEKIRASDRRRRLENKLKAVELLGGKCCKCGYNRFHGALEFHHTDPSKKDTTIKNVISGSWAKLEAELKKCILLCANCHRETHWRENG